MKKLILLSLLVLFSCSKERNNQDDFTNVVAAPSPTYTLSVSSSEGGSVNTSGGEYEQGSTVTINATANTGYTFTGWSGNATGTNTSLNITIIGNINVTANFEPISYSLTVDSGNGGSVSSTGGGYDYGTQVALSAIPDEGYVFSSWSNGLTDTNITITISDNTAITANFVEDPESTIENTSSESITPSYTLSVTAGDGGTVNTSGGEYQQGTSVDLIATPNTGYAFTGWSGNATGTDTSLTITIDGNTAVSANFEPISYTLSLNAGAGGFISSTGGTYDYGAQVTITATPDSGYLFSGWSDGSTEQSRTITITQDTTLTANFSENTQSTGGGSSGSTTTQPTTPSYTLSVTAGNGGSVNTSGGEYEQGSTVTINATANTGYTFTGWSGNATGTDTSLTITINGNTSITANFEAVYTLNVNAGNGGSVSSTGGTYNSGTQVTVSATADSGYTFASWSDGSTEQSRTITITQDTTLTANFEAITYTLAVNAGAGGSVSSTGGTYNSGTQVTVSATPDSGNAFYNWSDGSTENPRTISMTQDYSISAEFGSATHTLSTNSTNGGIVLVNGVGIGTTNTPGNGGTFNHGEEVNLSTEAIPYWEFKFWSGASSSNSSDITITMNSDVNITANFGYIIDTSGTVYNVTVITQAGGSVNWLFRTGASSQGESSTLTLPNSSVEWAKFYENDEIELTAVPNTGYSFVEWECTEGCSGTSSNTVFNLTVTDSNVSIIAKFQ